MSDDLLLEGVVGSVAYGLNHSGSDVDYSGIYVEPTARLLGLHPPSRERATRKGRGDADATYHELGKAMSLMLSCNPTASEILWLPEYTRTSTFGEELVALRSCFLSEKRVRDSFFGYATSQFHRLIDKGRFQGSLETRREKHARHTMRLLHQGYTLYATGVLPIRVPDPEKVREFGRRTAAEPDAASAKTLIAEYEALFDRARSVLPAAPDEAPLEDLLLRVRRAHWEGLGT
ncbi:nucleotidyltransferase domain-containing protein [Nocardia neocaledoniensis]|uniref:nucleotidyltransferase domain-containing protein n=1 Tax=Nocardia neocaledoniensis TaxID=236511 RepID=UPI0033DDCAA2